MDKPRLIIASIYAAILTIAFVVLITVWAELAVPLKDWLKAFSGHHWVSKSIFSLVLYTLATGVLYGFFGEPNADRLRKALILLFASVSLGIVVLSTFYTGHYLKVF